MAEASTAEAPKIKPGVTVVTGENFDAYVAEKLPPKLAPVVEEKDTPEAKAKAELAEIDAARKAKESKETKPPKQEESEEEIDHPDKDKKKGINERFSKITTDRKNAEAKAERETKSAAEARARADKAEQEAQALRAKYEPAKTDELGPEPLPAQFTDINEYSKALKDWTAEKTRSDDNKKRVEERNKQEQEAVVKAWKERQDAFKAETPDYEKVISESAVKVSDQVRDAILDSDVGPKLLYHMAQNPDVAEKIGKMSVPKALKEIGKLEAFFSAPPKDEKTEKQTIAEISKAPAPITPIKTSGTAATVHLSGSDEVPKNLSYEDWKALRKGGKIR